MNLIMVIFNPRKRRILFDFPKEVSDVFGAAVSFGDELDQLPTSSPIRQKGRALLDEMQQVVDSARELTS